MPENLVKSHHTIDEFPARKRGRPPIYEWDSYFDGQIHVLYQGTDFPTSTTSFRALVHRTANVRGWKAETQIDKRTNSVTFRFFVPGQEDED